MQVVSTFAVAFFFSFIGTIPPGTLNLTIIQLGLNDRIPIAFRIAVAAALVEYPYAWVAVQFQEALNMSVNMTENAKLFGSVLMIGLGALNLLSTMKPPSDRGRRLRENGFRIGIVLGILNPVAIPFWIALTAYVKGRGWVTLSNNLELHAYLLGVSAGTLVVFVLFACLAKRVVSRFKTSTLLPKLPGVLLFLLGIYAFGEYILG